MNEHVTYGTAVRNLQRYLRRIYDSDRSNTVFAVPVDGIYESATRDAISEFQRLKGLPVTGITDRQTWELLFSDYQLLADSNDKRVYPDFFPRVPVNYETDFGEKSSFISVLQFVLDELRASYGTLPSFEMNGIFDGDTSLAVKEFQRLHALPITGRVNRRTWNAMADAFNRYAV